MCTDPGFILVCPLTDPLPCCLPIYPICALIQLILRATELSAHLQQAAIRLPAVLPVPFASDSRLAANLEQARVAKVRLIITITLFATEEHTLCVFYPPIWLSADLHLACCPQGTTCCGKACCTPGFACVGDGDCQSTTPTTTSTTRSRTTTRGTSTTTTETSSAPTNQANPPNNAAVIGGAIGGTIGGLILILGGIAGIYLYIHRPRDNKGNPATPTTQQISGSQPLTPGTDYNQPQVSPYQQSTFYAAVPPSSASGPVPWSGSQIYVASSTPDPNNSAGSPSNTGRGTYGGTTAETMQPYGGYESHPSPGPQVQTWVEPSQRSGGN